MFIMPGWMGRFGVDRNGSMLLACFNAIMNKHEYENAEGGRI